MRKQHRRQLHAWWSRATLSIRSEDQITKRIMLAGNTGSAFGSHFKSDLTPTRIRRTDRGPRNSCAAPSSDACGVAAMHLDCLRDGALSLALAAHRPVIELGWPTPSLAGPCLAGLCLAGPCFAGPCFAAHVASRQAYPANRGRAAARGCIRQSRRLRTEA
jgi:hypothetical protein